jgi:hypothetical protein
MQTHTPRALIPAAVIVGGLILLPVLLIILGFDLVPLMAITAWSRAAWIAILVVIFIAAAVGMARLRSRPHV